MFEQSTDQAREQFERALQLKPDFAAAAYQLALLADRSDLPQSPRALARLPGTGTGNARGTRVGGARRRTLQRLQGP